MKLKLTSLLFIVVLGVNFLIVATEKGTGNWAPPLSVVVLVILLGAYGLFWIGGNLYLWTTYRQPDRPLVGALLNLPALIVAVVAVHAWIKSRPPTAAFTLGSATVDQPSAQREQPLTRGSVPGETLPSGTLLYSATSAGEIRRLAPDGQRLAPLAVGLGSPHDLHLAGGEGPLYIMQWKKPVVRVLSLATGELHPVYAGSGSGSGGQGIGVDVAADSLFWGEYYGGLYRGSPDGKAPPRRLVSPQDLGVCSGGVGVGVEVNPEARQVYFFSRDNCDARGRALWRVSYDGEGLTRLRPLESSDCLTLARQGGGWLYFSDLREGRFQLWRARLDGSEAGWLFDLPQPERPCAGIAVNAEANRLYFLQSSGEPHNVSDLWRSDLAGRRLELLDRHIPGGQGLLLVP